MSHAQAHREDQEQMEHDDSAQIQDEDIVEVVEDDGDEPMDEDDDDGEDGTGNPNDKYDGEIVIGAPSNPEEEAMWREMNQDGDAQNSVDNSWGVSALHAADKSVFTVSLHPSFPNPPLAVSGGEDDLAYIFCPLPGGEASSSAGPAFEPVKLTGHTDSVSATGWSANGEMVATGGMDGRVRVWRRAPSQRTGDAASKSGAATPAAEKTIDNYRRWEFLTSLETSSEVIWLTWHPRGNVLAAGCEDATVWMWSLPTGQTMAVLSSHTYPTTAGVFTESPGGILTTSEDSTLILWDPRTSQPVWKTSVFAHANVMELDPSVAGITALAVSPNGQLAAVGSANGLVKLVNVARGDVISRLEGHKEGDSVEALAFVDLLAGAGGGKGVVLVSGGTDGKGFVWDVATGRVRAELQHDESITSLAKHPAPTLHLVTTGSADRTLKTWDIRTGSLVAHHQGHMGVVNGVQVARAPPSASADGQGGQHGQVIVSAGDDGVSLIWRI